MFPENPKDPSGLGRYIGGIFREVGHKNVDVNNITNEQSLALENATVIFFDKIGNDGVMDHTQIIRNDGEIVDLFNTNQKGGFERVEISQRSSFDKDSTKDQVEYLFSAQAPQDDGVYVDFDIRLNDLRKSDWPEYFTKSVSYDLDNDMATIQFDSHEVSYGPQTWYGAGIWPGSTNSLEWKPEGYSFWGLVDNVTPRNTDSLDAQPFDFAEKTIEEIYRDL